MGILGIYGTTKAGLPVSQSAGLYVSGDTGLYGSGVGDQMKMNREMVGEQRGPWASRLLTAA